MKGSYDATLRALNNAAHDAARLARRHGAPDATALALIAHQTDLMVDALPSLSHAMQIADARHAARREAGE